MNKFQAACGFLMIATVAACSSSNSNGGGGTVALPVAGPFSLPVVAEGAPAMTASTLTDVLATLEVLDAAIDDGSVAEPTTAPTGEATLNGFVTIETAAEKLIVGNLEIVADFDSGSVISKARGFAEVAIDSEGVYSDVASSAEGSLGITGVGALAGRGFVDEGALFSTLDGALFTTADYLAVDLDLLGATYDNDGLLAIRGFVIGTVDELPVNGSDFAVLEE